MMFRKFISAFIISAAVGIPSVAAAAESCTVWMDQGNGTSAKTCVDDRGVQHCYVISNARGSTQYEVSCKKS